MARPLIRPCKCDDLSPVLKVGYDFEGFRDFTTSVSGEYFTYLSIYSFNFWVINGFLIYFFEFLF